MGHSAQTCKKWKQNGKLVIHSCLLWNSMKNSVETWIGGLSAVWKIFAEEMKKKKKQDGSKYLFAFPLWNRYVSGRVGQGDDDDDTGFALATVMHPPNEPPRGGTIFLFHIFCVSFLLFRIRWKRRARARASMARFVGIDRINEWGTHSTRNCSSCTIIALRKWSFVTE